MKRRNQSWALAAVFLAAMIWVLVPQAAAQNDGAIRGQILDVAGKPWQGIPVQITSDQGIKLDTKTDKDGNYTFRYLRGGIYNVSLTLPGQPKPYEEKCQVQGGSEARKDFNFKEIVGQQAGASEQAKKQDEDKAKFEGMKVHFAAGNTLVDQERAVKADLQKAPADQRDALKGKLTDLSNQAAAEYQAAQKSVAPADPNQHLFWEKLGEAYDIAGRNDEAIQAYQQAITVKADVPGDYNNLGNVLARAGKIEEAKAAYTKSAELDPPNAAMAWRNFGISLYNANRLGDAVEPLQKSVDLDPKSAQTWYLLGASLVYKMTTKKVGDKEEVVLAPGTVEAYQRALELDPSGQWGAQAKLGLEQLQLMAPGIDTKVNVRKKKS
jgi:tetratricopeptide (TPR) repeat protein